MLLGIPQMSAATLSLLVGLAVPTGPESKTGDAAELMAIQAVLKDEASDLPRAANQSSSCSVRLLSLALRYRRDPDKYRNDFFSTLVVDDYTDRAAGKYNFVDPDEIAATIDSAMAVPDGITENRIKAAVGFCALKDKNLWVSTKNAGRISLARLVRGMAVSSLLEGTDEDPLAITNAIDAQTATRGSPER